MSTIAIVRRTASFTCIFHSYPLFPSIDWYFNTNELLQNDSRINITTTSSVNATNGIIMTNTTLTISNVMIEDDGQHTCNAGEESASANLTVYGKPFSLYW